MVSLFNGIVRRGHTPREPAIQRMMVALGLTVGDQEGASDHDSMTEDEATESEAVTDDEEVADDDDHAMEIMSR